MYRFAFTGLSDMVWQGDSQLGGLQRVCKFAQMTQTVPGRSCRRTTLSQVARLLSIEAKAASVGRPVRSESAHRPGNRGNLATEQGGGRTS